MNVCYKASITASLCHKLICTVDTLIILFLFRLAATASLLIMLVDFMSKQTMVYMNKYCETLTKL